MADNVTIPVTGAGTATPVIATDDVGGVHFQKIKIDIGGDGASTAWAGAVTNSDTVVEDAASAGAERLFMAGAVRRDTAASSAGTDGDYATLNLDSVGRLWVASALIAQTSGGLSIDKNIDVDETEDVVKTSAGQIYGWFMYNAAATIRFIKYYDASVATVVVGTTVPTMTIPLAAGAGANVAFPHGIAFATAITIAATNLVADNDATAPGTNDVIVNTFYK